MKCQNFTIFRSLIFEAKKLFFRKTRVYSNNKRHLRADGFPLLPSALRPRLLSNRGEKSYNVAKIVVVTIILGSFSLFSLNFAIPVSAASLTLTIPSTLSLDITPTSSGAFAKSNPNTISVKTDDKFGYTLTIKAKGSENSNSLLSNASNKLNSIPEKATEDNFKTNSKFNNTWGYLPSKFNNEINTNFLPGPTIEESVIDTTEEANEEGNSYDITIAARVDNNTTSGEYTNTFIISSISNTPEIMQNWNGCDNLSSGQTVSLLDTRDNNIYHVAKLKDGKCWMTQNLRIENKVITPDNSNISEGTYTIPASSLESFGTSNTSPYVYINPTETKGGYYSWIAATAGANKITDNGISVNSICPKGWYLPTRDEYSNLIKNYNSTSIKSSPANFVLPGYIYNAKINSEDSYGYYWTSSIYNSSSTYSSKLNVYNSSTSPKMDSWSRYYGLSIRCINGTMNSLDYSVNYNLNGGMDGPTTNPQTGTTLESSITLSDEEPHKGGYRFVSWCTTNPNNNNICSGESYQPSDTYDLKKGTNITLYAVWDQIKYLGNLGDMQSFTCSKIERVGDYGTVIDNRDNNTYTVSKLKDNKCWMTENLRLGKEGSTMELTPEDTDITANYTLPASSKEGFGFDSTENVYVINEDSGNLKKEFGGYYTYKVSTAGISPWKVGGYGKSATTSICPKGWKLPTGGSSEESDFANLVKAYENNLNQLLDKPVPNFLLGGEIYDGVLSGQTSTGYYRSSTYAQNVQELYYGYYATYSLHINEQKWEYSDRYDMENRGYSIRCIAKE